MPVVGLNDASFLTKTKSSVAAPSGIITAYTLPDALVCKSIVNVPPPIALAVLSGLGVFSFHPSGQIAAAMNPG